MAKFEKSSYRQSSQVKVVSIAEIPRILEPIPDNLLEVYEICCILKGVCHRLQGIGLSAVQVGLPWNTYVVQGKFGYEYYINCSYSKIGDSNVTTMEGCLSLGDRRFKINRFEKIRLVGKQLTDDLKLINVNKELNGMDSIVHQHECDHAKGILICDIGEEVSIY